MSRAPSVAALLAAAIGAAPPCPGERCILVRPLAAQTPPRDSARVDSLRTYTLEPLAVSAPRASEGAGGPDRSPFTATRLGPDELRRGRPGVTLDEALIAVPGVTAQNRYNFSLDSRLAIRGFGARSAFGVRGIVLLLDGVPQTLPDGQGQLSNVDLGAADRIEVLRGAAAAFYGNAAGGVIAVSERAVPFGGPSASVRVVGGSFGMRRVEVEAALRAGPARTLLRVSRHVIHGFRDHSAADLRQVAASLAAPLSGNTEVVARLRYAEMPRADNPGSLTAAQLGADPAAANPFNVQQGAGKTVRQWQGALSVRRLVGPEGEASLALFGIQRSLQNPLPTAFVTLERTDLGARLSYRAPLPGPGRGGRLLAGVEVQRQADDRRNLTNAAGLPGETVLLDQLETVTAAGARAAIGIEVARATQLVLGVRGDRVRFRAEDRLLADGDDSGERVMGAWSWTVGLSRALGRSWQAYANAGTAFETPTTTELVNRPSGAGGLNPDLMPQHAVQWELGVRGATPRLPELSLAIYQARVEDELISFEVPAAPSRQFYRNAGSARHRGAELAATLLLARELSLRLAWTATDHRYLRFRTVTDSADGRFLPGSPRSFAYAVARAGGGTGLWLDVQTICAGRTWADDANRAQAPPWSATDVRLGWVLQRMGYRLAPFAAVYNLMGRRYVGSVVVNAAAGRYFEPAPGRNYYLGVEVGYALR